MLPILLIYGTISLPALAQAYLSLTIRSLIPPADTIALGRLLAGRMENVYGFIQYCDKCDDILPFNTPWILLTSLSRNSLESKLQAAVEKKATAVIIIADNVVDSVMQSTYFIMKSALERKYGPGSMDMPLILVSREDGGELAAISQLGGNVPVILEPTIHNHSNKNSILILTVVLLVASVIAGICYSMYQRRDIVPPIIRACPYQIAVSKIPSQELTDSQDPACDDEMKCAICLECFQLNEVISHLPCKHVFHKDCIDPWLIEKRLCPMCKMDVVKFYGAVNIGSEESIVDIPLDEPTVSNDDGDELIDED